MTSLYTFAVAYLLTSFLYFVFFNIFIEILQTSYNSASSKNRIELKSTLKKVEKRNKVYVALLWLPFEIYYKAKER